MPTVPQEEFQFCGPSYQSISTSLDAQRCINLHPERGISSSKNVLGLIGRPGLVTFGTLPLTPVRGLWAGVSAGPATRFFACGGTNIYELNAAGAVSVNYGVMPGTTGTGPVAFFANGTQMLSCDYVGRVIDFVNPVGPAVNTILYGANPLRGTALEYLDGFYVIIGSDTTLAGSNPNQVNVSANGDGTTWSTLAFNIRTGAADLTNQLATLNGLLWVFGQKTIEVWYDAGTPIFPFARVQGASINIGCLSPYSVVKFNNTLMWLGVDDKGYAQVYMAQGMNPIRVSNPPIEWRITLLSNSNVTNALAYGYQEAGHTFYVLNFVNSAFQPVGVSLVYDLTLGLWHERIWGTIGFPLAAEWPGYFACQPGFNSTSGMNFVGDLNSGRISRQNINLASDNGVAITYIRNSPHVSNLNRAVIHNRFEVEGNLGSATPTLNWSNDGGQTFAYGNRSLQQAQDNSIPGTRRRFYANQLGRARDRVYQFTVTSSTDLIQISNAYLDVSPGTEP